jgi:hypothetical protein
MNELPRCLVVRVSEQDRLFVLNVLNLYPAREADPLIILLLKI